MEQPFPNQKEALSLFRRLFRCLVDGFFNVVHGIFSSVAGILSGILSRIANFFEGSAGIVSGVLHCISNITGSFFNRISCFTSSIFDRFSSRCVFRCGFVASAASSEHESGGTDHQEFLHNYLPLLQVMMTGQLCTICRT